MTTSKEEALLEEEPEKRPFSSKDFPSVFEECNNMILASIIVYGVVDLRRLANMGVLKGCGIQELEELPISAAAIVRLVAQNREALCHQIGEGSTELYLEAFDSLVEQDAFELEYNVETGETFLASFDVVQVGDQHSESELVHDISVNTSEQQITVAFRGCTTNTDWRVSANPFLSSHSNPAMIEHCEDGEVNYNCCLSDEEPKKVSIHGGFYNYLFRPAQHDQGTNKFDTIMASLETLQKQYPGYHIYVTGHSLGGALSTVFAFFAAASGMFRDPITCIPIASPMVGNLSFEEAFKSLERQGRLRCLRITNYMDIFTQLPDRGAILYASFYWGLPIVITSTALFFFCCQNYVYRHVGMDLHLYDNKSFKIKHARGSFSNYCWRVMHDWKQHLKRLIQRIMTVPFACCCDLCCCKQDFNANHGIQEHLERLHARSNELNHVYLNELYENKRFSKQ